MRKSIGKWSEGVSEQRLILPAELEDGRIPRIFSRLSYFFSGIILAVLVWGSFAQIRELAVAQGQIVPMGSVQQVQHLEGGQVERILVKEGQIVEEGAALAHLRPTAAQSDLKQLRARAAGLELQRETLAAIAQSRQPSYGKLGRQFPELAAQQLEVFRSKLAHREQERKTLEARSAQRRAEIASLSDELQSLARQIELKQQQLDIRTKLRERGLTSRVTYLDAKSSLEEVNARSIATTGRIESAREQLREAQSQLRALKADGTRILAEERSKISAELAELQQQIAKHRDRVDRLVVRAPARGIIQELAQHAPGEVIRPGDIVARIVPLNKGILAEVRLDPKDVGHVKAGDAAEIKVSTFDPNVFGVVNGTVERISATTFESEDGGLYYKAVIGLARSSVGANGNRRAILPGMVVQADIITGSKSLMKYILKPIYRSLDASFRER
ncbi:MAG: HlyD family type I secretion periplasmic adaptor subunit [Methyloligellaceae bacterium]